MNPLNNRYLIALSGGLDSCVAFAHTLFYKRLKPGFEITPVSFFYGSKHNPVEIEAAQKIVSHYQEKNSNKSGLIHNHILINVENLIIKEGSTLTDSTRTIPEGHYESPQMSQTVVPGRNLLFLSILAGWAEARGIGNIVIGVHSGDHHIYPDCRPDFIKAAREVIFCSTERKVHIHTPFLTMSKAEIVQQGDFLEAPFELTRTCYTANSVACGKCGACNERRESFANVGIIDPIPYQ